MIHSKFKIVFVFILISFGKSYVSLAQYWQQKVDYKMEIILDDESHQFQGKQILTYYNNSPDTIRRVFYHLFYNAFQPGSMMDIRSQYVAGSEKDIALIKNLNADEIGYSRVKFLSQDKHEVQFEEQESILVVDLDHPLLPGKKTVLTMEFEAQVPVYIRRTGRDNKEGIAYSMAQWYPKLCEYDRSGWHADPYVGREFFGVWGDFDVKITLPSDYVLGGTGKVMNPTVVKHGYGAIEGRPETENVTWHFNAKNVHDFVWAADKDYLHEIVKVNDDLDVHLLFQADSVYEANWIALSLIINPLFNFVNERFGKYAYDSYSIIQGGDRGMEYPMATLFNGKRSYKSMLGTCIHELLHEWYYFALATNEMEYAWMDEGFTSYADKFAENYITNNDSTSIPDYSYSRKRTIALMKSETNEALSTNVNYLETESAFSINSYNKGAMYLSQLAYIIGQDKLDETLLRYYYDWRFKHPTPEDFMLVGEKVSGIELDWYNNYYINSIKKLDYGIKSLVGSKEEVKVVLERIEDFIMPVDLEVQLRNGEVYLYTIPLQMMRGHKNNQGYDHFEVLKAWPWVEPEYTLVLPFDVNEILSLAIDPRFMTVDIDPENNSMIIDPPVGTELIIETK